MTINDKIYRVQNTIDKAKLADKLMSCASCILIAVFLFIPSLAFSQIDTTKANIYIIARPTTDSILLRWAPGDYKYWGLGNKYGYNLVRYTLIRDSVLLSAPEVKNLTPKGVAPWPLNSWEELVKNNKYGGIAAQAIYGESFEVDAGEGTTPEKVNYKAREQKQRYSFALYAADIAPKVAKASGLWFTDNTAQKNEMYLYRVFFNLPDSLSDKNDTAFVFTGIRDYTILPLPIELTAEFGDKTAVLSWNTFAQNNIYIAWEIERSSNGKNFTLLNLDPFVSVAPVEDVNPEYTYKYDSLPYNNKEIFYKVRGISSFGEYGPWSKVISGKGVEAIKATPNITGYEIIKEKVKIDWEFPVEMESAISGFKVLRSNNHKLGYEIIYTKLKPGNRTFTDKKPLGTNYYKIMAYKDSSAQKLSFPYMIQLTDNTPPIKPKELAGKVDSLGIVTLVWQPNPDEDIYGYRIFRSASGNDEFSQRTHRPVADTFYIDTISKKDLNASVFYKIIAVDLRQNQSEFSDVAELIKPDDIAPSIPVITNTKALPEGIQLTWINSTSNDVERHDIYRFIKGDSAWMKITEISFKKRSKETMYIDYNCSVHASNQYKVIAVDKSGNNSDPSLSISIIGLRNHKSEGLQKITQQADYKNGKIYLSWQLPENPIEYIKVYRKTKEKDYSLFETLEGKSTEFEDYGMKVGEFYAYRIKLLYANGSVSGFSNEIKIEF